MKSDANPMHKAHDAPRCHAKAKSTGNRCKAPACRGWTVCRMHGAGGGQPPGPKHPSWRHGLRSQDWIGERSILNRIMREARETEARVDLTQSKPN
jgi:hypothetical protein